MATIIEAENMTLVGYDPTPEVLIGASGDEIIRLSGNANSGTATTSFTGLPPGIYDINVVYFDESDGESDAEFRVNGTAVDSWTFDSSPGGTRPTLDNRVTRTISGVSLASNDSLELFGTRNQGENARFDYIELIPVDLFPDAVDDSETTPEDTPVTINVTGNDTDVLVDGIPTGQINITTQPT
ncbi:MAG: hypothetical protein WA933_10870, partial [Microcoleaceae cyanobacterium]